MLSLDLQINRAAENELRQASTTAAGILRDAATSGNGQELSSRDHNNVARCLEVDATKWLIAVDWARKSGNFSDLTINVAATLAVYAAQGWTRTPSPKQAKHGATIIEAARIAGVLER
jgi:hypothetical protein